MPHRADADVAAGRRVHVDVARCPGPQEYDRPQMRGQRQHRSVHHRVAVEDDACIREQGGELCGGWIALVYDQRVPHAQGVERVAHDRRTVDKDDRHRRAKRRWLRGSRLRIIRHWWGEPSSTLLLEPSATTPKAAKPCRRALLGGPGPTRLAGSDRRPALDYG